MALNPEVAIQIEEIRQDRIHGASWLSRQAISIMNLAAEKSEAKDVADFLEELRLVGRELMNSKPSMAPMTNRISCFIYEISQESQTEKELGSLRKLARSKAFELAKDAEEAFSKVAEQGIKVIKNRDRIMTCSYSSTICQALRLAKLAGKEFNVLVSESRSSSGKAYGESTAEQIKVYGIPAEIIPDNTIEHYISRVDRVLVGADSILADGSLINGTPTRRVTVAAKEGKIPAYSLCEIAKFDVRSCLELEEGFDRVPPYLITGVITEKGKMKPSEVISYIKEMERYVKTQIQSSRSDSATPPPGQ